MRFHSRVSLAGSASRDVASLIAIAALCLSACATDDDGADDVRDADPDAPHEVLADVTAPADGTAVPDADATVDDGASEDAVVAHDGVSDTSLVPDGTPDDTTVVSDTASDDATHDSAPEDVPDSATPHDTDRADSAPHDDAAGDTSSPDTASSDSAPADSDDAPGADATADATAADATADAADTATADVVADTTTADVAADATTNDAAADADVAADADAADATADGDDPHDASCTDADHDGTCDDDDLCMGGDDADDADRDGVPDVCDRCAAGPDDLDADRDGTPDACDCDGTLVCSAGFVCAIDHDAHSGHGVAACVCAPGRFGVACAGTCACEHGGRCDDGLTGDGSCFCPVGFGGPDCGTPDPCAGIACVNGACVVHGDTWRCACTSGYGGPLCADDVDGCTTDPCAAGVLCTDVPAPGVGSTCGPCPRALVDDRDACTVDACDGRTGVATHTRSVPDGTCCSPSSGLLQTIDDDDVCTVDTCDPGSGVVTHAATTPEGQCCARDSGDLTAMSDGDACTIDVCDRDTGEVAHRPWAPAGQCCAPRTGVLTALSDDNACTADACNPDTGGARHTSTVPVGQCCAPATGALTAIDDGDVCSVDACDPATGEVSHVVPDRCGDGTTDAACGEACDDGDRDDGDGCDAECQVEGCGDGIVHGTLGEACDDGDANSDTAPGACRTTCVFAGCGDGTVDPREECDDGDDNSDVAPDACRTTCVRARCGDGVEDDGEGCDDGNRLDDDGCGPTCALEYCGDGALQLSAGETCDDGGEADDDGCAGDCVVESCGDGVKQAALGEDCDEGPAGDATCTPACKTRVCTTETCNGVDDDCDQTIDEGCSPNNVAYMALSNGKPALALKPNPKWCSSVYDCNDNDIYTTDVCTSGACSWTDIACDGPDPDRCKDGATFGSATACADVGPILLWDFDLDPAARSTSTGILGTAIDTSGSGRGGVLVATYTDPPPTPRPSPAEPSGRLGKALRFRHGASETQTWVEREMKLKATDFTMSAWFKASPAADGTPASGAIFAAVGKDSIAQVKTVCGVDTAAGSIGHDKVGDPLTPTDREVYLKGGKIAWYVNLGPNPNPILPGACEGKGPRVDDGAWHHVAISCNSSRGTLTDGFLGCKLWLDGGQIVGCNSLPDANTSRLQRQAKLAVGWSQKGGFFKGAIDQVAVWDVPLTHTEIVDLYYGGQGRALSAADGSNLERCDTVDNDCDGETDESCDDGDAATKTDGCVAGVCVGVKDPCPTDPCMIVERDPTSGLCVSRVDPNKTGASCDDGVACTANEKCTAAGLCVGALAGNCGTDVGMFDPNDRNIIVYDLGSNSGGLTAIIPVNPGTAGFSGWTKKAGTTNTYTYAGAFLFSHAVYDKATGKYAYPHPRTVSFGDVVVSLDPFTLGGTIGIPWTTEGFFGQMGVPGVGTPSLALGIQPGSTLQHLNAPLQLDKNYYYLSGDVQFALAFPNAPSIPIFGPQFTVVLDPNDPMLYLAGPAEKTFKKDQVFYPDKTQDIPGVHLILKELGFSLHGKLRHKAKLDVWDGTAFIPAVNDAHLFIGGSVLVTPFIGFKWGITGKFSLNYDPDRNGYDPNESNRQTGDLLANGKTGADRADFRAMLEGGMDVLFGPLKTFNGRIIANPFNGLPIYVPLRLADAVTILDIRPDRDIWRLRAKTADLPFRSVPGLSEIFTTECTGYDIDINAFVDKPVGGEADWGVSFRVAAGLPLGPAGVAFHGTFEFGSKGIVLDGAVYLGRLKINPEFDLGTVEGRFEFDGDRFCTERNFPSPNLILEPGKPDKQTTCNVRICIGKDGFDGTTFDCDPFCTGNAECDPGEACVFGVCGEPVPNGAPCTNNTMCDSGRCYIGSCVECWPGQDDCGGDLFCDNAGYCQDKLDTGELCLSLASGLNVMRNDWCKSGKCDTTCLECWSPNAINVLRGQIDADFRTFDCPDGKVCSDFGICMDKRQPGQSCYSTGAVAGIDAWCSTDSCGDPFWTCRGCNAETFDGTPLDCPADQWCEKWALLPSPDGAPTNSNTCKPKWDDDHACLGDVECKSGHCSELFPVPGGCYTQFADAYGAACLEDEECESRTCNVTFCGCADDDSNCPSGERCILGDVCLKPVPKGAPCTDEDEQCESNHCLGAVCAECEADEHCPDGEICFYGACLEPAPNGTPCTEARECASAKCRDLHCVECLTGADCADTEWCDATGACQPQWDDDHACYSPVECKSGHCSAQGPLPGSCYSQYTKAYGAGCVYGDECASHACTAIEGFIGTVCNCNGSYSNCPDGENCNAVDLCTATGAGCDDDAQCRSGACGINLAVPVLACVQCIDGGDCDGDAWCDALGACQPKWETGHACYSGVECQSGHCNNVSVAPGFCYDQYAKPNASTCIYDDECASTHCFNALCTECEVDADCGSHHLCTLGACVYVPYCGDGTCGAGESCVTCADDCGACCGNGVCEIGYGETCGWCNDCACGTHYTCSAGTACTYVPYCGDGTCNIGENCQNCDADCGCSGNTECSLGICSLLPFCGDQVCNNGETCGSCPGDCGGCGCSGDEQCPCGQYCDVYWDIPGTGSNTCKDRVGPGAYCYRSGNCWRTTPCGTPSVCEYSAFWGRNACR